MAKEIQAELKSALGQARSILEDLERVGLGEVLPTGEDERLPVCNLDGSGNCRPETLEEIAADLGDCHRCNLSKERQNIVFGVGNPDAEIVFVGEGPGREEDLRGEPFVGEAGRLLDRIIQAMGFQRSDVYICNVVKCRPPRNRDPEAEEIAACEPFLQRQLAAIRPRVIVALGKFAAQTLLQSQTPISRLRGRWAEYHGIPLMPTFHPAYLLRTPSGKRDVWEDMKQVMKRVEED
ncbi:MAG: DNA polymerase [Desulfuromonas sp.]|nr:MAG: DNA polymerase [Desulfuromonas sp.]